MPSCYNLWNLHRQCLLTTWSLLFIKYFPISQYFSINGMYLTSYFKDHLNKQVWVSVTAKESHWWIVVVVNAKNAENVNSIALFLILRAAICKINSPYNNKHQYWINKRHSASSCSSHFTFPLLQHNREVLLQKLKMFDLSFWGSSIIVSITTLYIWTPTIEHFISTYVFTYLSTCNTRYLIFVGKY